MVLAGLAFLTAQDAMQSEIEHGLAAQAEAISSNINRIMFERLQNAATWSTLEVMQDMQVQDVDKRLSNFLAKLNSGYGGVYSNLKVLDRHRLIVSSSDPAEIGKVAAAAPAWQTLNLAGANLTLDAPVNISASGVAGQSRLTIRAPINSPFNSDPLGELALDFNWEQINALLDNAASDLRMVALVDSEGKIVAASRTLRTAGLLNGRALAGWQLTADARGAIVRSGAPVWASAVVVGIGRPVNFAGFNGAGLSTLVIQPESEALSPVRRIALISIAMLGGIVLLTFGVANKVSALLARPITALTALTKNYKLGQKSLTAQALPDLAEGELGELELAFIQMVQDIDLAQRDLVRASKLAMVGEMASIIIHEVRTPLGIIKSSAQMLKRESALSAEGMELTGFIESETERLNRLVSSMLDSARPRGLNPGPTDLHGLLHQSGILLGSQLEKAQIEISEEFDAVDPIIDCDAEQITQVLLNLIMNALQILPPGGKILLTTYQVRDHHDGAPSDSIFIAVSDNGPGIAPLDRERIFDAFFCRRDGGIGLGLAIVQQIILAHHGRIEVSQSKLGGACFTIQLPKRAIDLNEKSK